jgi:galactose-1-phosphate uridylyltransferase
MYKIRRKNMPSIEEVMQQLPPELQQEVLDFAQYLLDTKVRRKQKKLRMTWAGALREFRDRYTSLDLQKKALEWWGD